MSKLKFIDLFAGCSGLSEGFVQSGFEPIAHIEMDEAACNSIKTRMAYHWLKEKNKLSIYKDYLEKKISREEFYSTIPDNVLSSVICEEISEASIKPIFKKIDKMLNGSKVDIIIGGPPCQAYSLIGRASSLNGMVGDKRNYLFIHYAEFLKKYKPRCFIFENVLGLLSAKDENGDKYIDMMFNLFDEVGYFCDYKIINSEDYGVPQKRKRVIIFGSLKKSKMPYPLLKKTGLNYTVNDVLMDLPKLKSGEGDVWRAKLLNKKTPYLDALGISNDFLPVTYHNARLNNKQDLEIYRLVVKKWNNDKSRLNYNELPENLKSHQNRNSFTDRFKVVSADLKSSHTVVAHISKDGHYYIHPDIKQNRSITPREAARLQTFPDDFFFESVTGVPSRTMAFKQIGNAVPPYLAKQIALAIKNEM